MDLRYIRYIMYIRYHHVIFSWQLVWMVESASSYLTFSGLPVGRLFCLWPTWDIYMASVLPHDISFLSLIVVEWSIWFWLCVRGCWSHCTLMQGCDDYPMGGKNLYEWAFCKPLWWRFHLPVVLWWYLKRVWNYLLWILPQWTGWKGPLSWCAYRMHPCVTSVVSQRFHQHTSSISFGAQCSCDGSVFKSLHVD